MATRVIFQDPIAQYLNRYKITHLGEDLYEIQISPGTVTQEGTPLIAANLNSITNEVIFHVEDTNEQANVFEANIQGLGEYYTSLSIIMKSNTTNTSASTINLSGLGVKAIKKVDKNGNKINVQENDIIRNKYEMFVYDGTDFILVNPNADIAQLISDLNSIEKKVNSLSQDVQNMKNFTPRFATTTGINNDYDINIDGIAQYVTGMRITIVADRTNTGSSTLNVNSLGKKNILFNGSSIPANTLQTNKLYDVIYNGVSFELQPSASQASKLNDIGNINDSTLPIELKGKVLTEQTKQIKKEVDEHKADYANLKSDYEYQLATIIDRQIRLQKLSDTNILKFRLNEDILEGAQITISLDGGTTSKPLVDVENNPIIELEKGFVEVISDDVNFTLRPKGASLKYFESIIAESISYGGVIEAFSYDENYIYAGGRTTNKVWKLKKTDLTKVGETIIYDGTIRAMTSDENYLYIYGEGENPTLWKVNKLNMVKVAEVAVDAKYFFSIIQDTDYIYEIEGNFHIVYKVKKSDMQKTKDKYFNKSPLALAQDENYLYVGCGTGTVFKLNKSDMQVVAESSDIGHDPSTMVVDNKYIYAGGSNNTAYGTITKIRKTDMNKIAESVRYLSEPSSLSQDDNYIYWGSHHSIHKIRKSDLGKVAEAWNVKASMLICDGLNVYANSGVSYLTVQKLDKWLTNYYIYKDKVLKLLEV